MDVKNYIRDIPDFPKDGIIYKDITPLLKDYKAFSFVVNEISKSISDDVESIIAPESRGFIFASAVCYKMNKNLVLVRKKGKLPYKTFEVEYELEYGTDTFQIHTDSIEENSKVAIIDDLLATGGTAEAAAELITKQGAEIVGFSFVVELAFLKGRKILEKYTKNITSIIDY